MMARLWTGIARHWSSRRLEWVLAFALVLQALRLLSAPSIANNRVYRVLAAMVPERLLGYVALALGLAWLTALILNGTIVSFRRVSPWSRAALALAATIYWALWTIALNSAIGPVTSTADINHAVLAVLAATCFLTCHQEVAVADERAAACRRRQTS